MVTKQQIADMFANGCFTAEGWKNLFQLVRVGAPNIPLRTLSKTSTEETRRDNIATLSLPDSAYGDLMREMPLNIRNSNMKNFRGALDKQNCNAYGADS